MGMLMRQEGNEAADALKLQLLQGERAWASLEEARQCVLCEHTFKGRQVRIRRDRSGIPHLCCPTPRCPATPAQWIHPENPLISEDAWRDWMRLLDTLCEESIRPAFGIRKRQVVRIKKQRAFGSSKPPRAPQMANCSAA